MALARSSYLNKRRKKSGIKPVKLIVGAVSVLLVIIGVAVAVHVTRAPSEAAVKIEPIKLPVFTTDILVPIETIQVGVALQPGMFRKEPKLEDLVTGDMVRGFEELKGMYSRGVLFKGQPILKAALTNRQPVHVLTALLPRDYRAVAIEVERPLLDNVDGWAQPGTDVDVVWITSVFGREMAAVLAGPVRVLASNKTTEWSPAKNTATQGDKLVTVTLLLSARDAVRVSLAAMHGKLSLGLRGLNDKRPNDGARPVSTVVEDRAVKEEPRGLLSVKVIDPTSRGAEVRKYDASGRRVAE